LDYLAANLARPFHATSVWDTIAAVPELLTQEVLRQFGYVWHHSGWTRAGLDAQHPGLFQAVVFYYAEDHLQVSPVISARAGRGLRKLQAIQGFAGEEKPSVEALRIAQDHPDWQNLRVLQLLLGREGMVLL
jgi:hypothetical protein